MYEWLQGNGSGYLRGQELAGIRGNRIKSKGCKKHQVHKNNMICVSFTISNASINGDEPGRYKLKQVNIQSLPFYAIQVRRRDKLTTQEIKHID